MMKFFKIILPLLLFFYCPVTKATHNRAGEITFTKVSDYTYSIHIITYTYSKSLADRPQLEVDWGDKTSSVVNRTPYYRNETEILPGYYQVNNYYGTHTFPGQGIYKILVQDPNRNFGVLNIPNSVNVVFSISTTIMVSGSLGENSTPVLLSPPIDKAARGHVFIHNPVAYDADGDSISYRMSTCRGDNGIPIQSYSLPNSSNQPVYIDEVTGNLVWNTPVDTGIYNIAIEIDEWRSELKIGSILRDMQIEVYNTDNNPPVNQIIDDYCVVAGETVSFEITTTDLDNDSILHEFMGGPFQLSGPPVYTTIVDQPGIKTTRFTWVTNCNHVRRLPYNLILKSTDQNSDVKLVDIENFSIKVISPPPENLVAQATNTTIQLTWDALNCNNITGYQIFRRTGPSGFVPGYCQPGVTPESGFVKIADVSSDITSYIDNENGQGLTQGLEYCYVIAAEYADGALSVISNESCDILLPGVPPIMNASVTNIDETNGTVYLSWIRPRHLDTIPANGPYEIVIYRSDDLSGSNNEQIHSFETTDLMDTTYTDQNLNTVDFPYSYTVEMYNNESGNRFLIGNPETASTLYPDIVAGDNQLLLNFTKNIPWLNNKYVVYRENNLTGLFDSIGTTNKGFYIDNLLKNGIQYCYRVKSYGWRIIDSLNYTNINWSHINCGIPVDTFPPCPPDLEVHSLCDSAVNQLVWTNNCANDVIRYRIFFASGIEDELQEIAVIYNPDDTIYFHIPENGLAGCYAVSAIDSFNNESDLSVKVCVDECGGYALPNIFTPNGDGIHDIYISINPGDYVKEVNMKIFNRWGVLVYETNDPAINWDGRYYKNNKIVSSGVYYYTCEVYENRLIGIVSSSLVGFIHVYSKESDNPFIE